MENLTKPYIVIDDIPPRILKPILNFIYQSEIKIALEDVDQFFHVAHKLKIRGMTKNVSIPQKKNQNPSNQTNNSKKRKYKSARYNSCDFLKAFFQKLFYRALEEMKKVRKTSKNTAEAESNQTDNELIEKDVSILLNNIVIL